MLLKTGPLSKAMLIAPPNIQDSLNTAGPTWQLMTDNQKEWLKSVPHSIAPGTS